MSKLKNWFYYTRSGMVFGLIGFAITALPVLTMASLVEGIGPVRDTLRQFPRLVKDEWASRK